MEGGWVFVAVSGRGSGRGRGGRCGELMKLEEMKREREGKGREGGTRADQRARMGGEERSMENEGYESHVAMTADTDFPLRNFLRDFLIGLIW